MMGELLGLGLDGSRLRFLGRQGTGGNGERAVDRRGPTHSAGGGSGDAR